MKRLFAAACAGALVLALAACSGGPAGSGSSAQGGAASEGNAVQSQGGASGSAGQSQQHTATLYIGMDGRFESYPLTQEGEITPEDLVAGIAGLTGWNLDLAGEITDGKGGLTVPFAATSALFVGPPEEQEEQFHVYDSVQLAQTILDSVKKTLQNWAVDPELGDPDSVDVYFCGPDGGDLVLEGAGVTISASQPYQGLAG